MKKNEQYKLALPKMKQSVELSDTITLNKKKIKWLNYACEMEIAFENEKFKVPVKMAYDDKDGTLEFSIGISTPEKDDPNDELDDELFYYQAKNLVQDLASGKLKGMTTEAIAKRHGLSLENKIKWGGVEVEPLLCGYIKVDVATSKIIEGGVVASLEAEGGVKWYPAVTGGLCYIKGKLGVGGTLKFAVELKDDVFEFKTNVEITQGMGVSGNIGTDNNHLGIGVDGELKEEFPFPYNKDEFKVTGEVKTYAEGVFFGEVVHRSEWKIDKQFYPKVQDKPSSGGGGGHGHFSVDEDLLSDMEYSLVSRNYLSGEAKEDDSFEGEVPVYPYGSPEMCRLSDGTVIAVWLNDDGSKDAANRTTLVYSVCKNGEWSKPLAVAETERADYYPSLVAQNNKAYLVWTNIGKVMTEETELREETMNTDIYFAVYSNGTFSEPQLVSLADNKKLETEAMIAASDKKQTVLWVENTENNVMLCTGKNTIVARTLTEGEWQDAVCIADDINAIYSVTAGYVNGVLYVVYAADSDGNIETVDDVDLYLYHAGYTEKLTNDKKINRCVQILGDRLYWLADGSLMQMSLTDATAVSSLGIENIDNFRMLANSKGARAVVFSKNNGFYGELYMAREDKNGFESPTPVTDYGNKVSDYAAVYMTDGSLMTKIFETKVNFDEDDGLSYGDTYIRNNATTSASNLQVTGSYLCARDVVAGETIPVDIFLYNGASQALTGVKVLFTGNGISQTEEVKCNLAGGEKGYITVNWIVPYPVIAQLVKIEVMPVNYTDLNITDNSVVQQIGGGDASVKSAEIAFDSTKNKNMINVIVENCGNQQLNNVTFELLKDGQYGEQIYTESFALAAGAEQMMLLMKKKHRQLL